MKPPKGVRLPLLLVLGLDLLGLLLVPMVYAFCYASQTSMAKYGVTLPEFAFEPRGWG